MEKPNEHNFDEEYNLDSEWADFNAKLADSRDMDFLRDKLILDQMTEDTLAKVVNYGVDTLVSCNDEEGINLYAEYFERRVNEIMGGYADMTDDTPDLDQAVRSVLMEYFSRVDMEYSTIESAVNIEYLMSCSENKVNAGLLVTDEKKMTQARLLILHGLDLDHPWQKMFNDITPGEGLDVRRHGDSVYTASALNEKKFHDYAEQRKLQLMDRAYSIVGRHEDEENVAIRGLTTSVALKMFYTAQAGPFTTMSEIDVNEFLWGLARELPRDNDTLKELVLLFKVG